MNFQLAKQAETRAIKRPGEKPNELLVVKKYSKEANAREYATAKFQTNVITYRLEMMPILYIIQALQPLRFNIFSKIFSRHSLVSLGTCPRSRRCAERTRQGEGRWSRPPKPAHEPSYIRPRIPVPRIAYLDRDKKLLTKVHDTKE